MLQMSWFLDQMCISMGFINFWKDFENFWKLVNFWPQNWPRGPRNPTFGPKFSPWGPRNPNSSDKIIIQWCYKKNKNNWLPCFNLIEDQWPAIWKLLLFLHYAFVIRSYLINFTYLLLFMSMISVILGQFIQRR